MRTRALTLTAMTAAMSLAIVAGAVAPAQADAAKPGASMTHIKTVAGLASTLEGAGVILYTQGGATSGVIGESLAAANSQVVLHVPVTGTKSGVRHVGSVLVFYNTANNAQVQLQNPVIDLTKGVVTATVPQAGGQATTVLTITNAASLKPVVKTDRQAGIRTTTYTGAQLAIGPGVGAVLNGTLGLPAGTIADGSAFATAEVTLNSAIPAS
jgi:hypothetical protein